MRSRFRDIRRGRGDSQQELATRVGISVSIVSRFENGEDTARSPRMRRKLADGYGVSIEEINSACEESEQPAATSATG